MTQIAQVAHIKHVKVLRYRPEAGDLIIEAAWVGNLALSAKLWRPTPLLQQGAAFKLRRPLE